MFRTLTILVAFCISAPTFGAPDLEQEARQFLARYVALGDAYDVAVADLYSDDAVIRSYRRYPHGLERSLEMKGAQWKDLIRKVMPLAKAQNDRSEYKEPSFVVGEGRVRIDAKRYSVRKCYWDPEYYLVVARQPDGSLKIIEEYSETQPQSDC
jgi:ketosteroid isomerase-like protein